MSRLSSIIDSILSRLVVLRCCLTCLFRDQFESRRHMPEPTQCSCHVRFNSSIAIPGDLAFHHDSDALDGSLGLFLTSKYEVYHMRRECKFGELPVPIREDGRDPKHCIIDIKMESGSSNQDVDNQQGSQDECKKSPLNVTSNINNSNNPLPRYVVDFDDDGTSVKRRHDPDMRVVYYIYKIPFDKRQRILQYATFTIAHLGVFAFLFQVFDDRGVIMQACFYFQLFILLLCFMLYSFSYLIDIMIVQNIKKRAKKFEDDQREHYDIRPDGVREYVHRIYLVKQVSLSHHQKEEKIRELARSRPSLDNSHISHNNSFIYPALDPLFALSSIMIECLTIVYIYNNT